MFRLLAVLLSVLIAVPSAFAGELQLKLIKVDDLNGFEQPLPAFSILVPVDWKTEGGIVWAFNGSGCGFGTPYINWTATGPDGISGVQLLPTENWGGMSYAANTEGCPKVMAQHLPEFLAFYIKRYRGKVRNFRYTPHPELAAEINKNASRTSNALGGVSLYYAEAGDATFDWDWNGRTVREVVRLSVVFNVTSDPGGYDSVFLSVIGGVSMRAPENIDPLSYEILAHTFLPVPGYVAIIQEFQRRMQAIALKGTMDRAAIWRKVQAEIGAMITQVYADAQATYDRVAADASRAMRGVGVYTDPKTGQEIELPNSASVWQMPDGTYVISDDPNYDPKAEHGDGGKKMNK